MKLNGLIWTAGLVIALEMRPGLAGPATNETTLRANPRAGAPGSLWVYPGFNYTNLLGPLSKGLSNQFQFKIPWPAAKGAPSDALKPGVYTTEPYSCIVRVPGAHPDDSSAISPGETTSPMPVGRPELRFTPRK